MRASIALALLLTACGSSSSPSSPTPPAPAQVTVTAALTETLTGATVGATSQNVDRLPALLTFSQPGYVSRQAYVGEARPTVDLIKDAAPFDMGFYRQLVRNDFDAPGNLQPLRVLTQNPSIYLQAAGLTASNVAALEAAARAIVPAFTGGKLNVAAFQTGDTLRADAAGWITVELVTDDAKTCGLANVGTPAGHIWLDTVARCGDGRQTIDPGVFAHEIGHALGFYHVNSPDALMLPNVRRSVAVSSQERYHASIAYSRQNGNRDPDNDAVTSTPLSVRSNIMVVD